MTQINLTHTHNILYISTMQQMILLVTKNTPKRTIIIKKTNLRSLDYNFSGFMSFTYWHVVVCLSGAPFTNMD